MRKDLSMMIKRACFHEAGHALLTFKFDIPIKYIELKVKKENDLVWFNGMTEHEVYKMNEDLRGDNGEDAANQVFLKDLTIRWAGIVSEHERFGSNDPTWGAGHDLKEISQRLSLIKKDSGYLPEEVSQACIEVARSTIRENHNRLIRLVNELSRGLKEGRNYVRIGGKRVIEILTGMNLGHKDLKGGDDLQSEGWPETR